MFCLTIFRKQVPDATQPAVGNVPLKPINVQPKWGRLKPIACKKTKISLERKKLEQPDRIQQPDEPVHGGSLDLVIIYIIA